MEGWKVGRKAMSIEAGSLPKHTRKYIVEDTILGCRSFTSIVNASQLGAKVEGSKGHTVTLAATN